MDGKRTGSAGRGQSTAQAQSIGVGLGGGLPGGVPGSGRGRGTSRGGAYQLTELTPVYVISVAAQLSGLHPQTLRQYDRLGLVCPDRTAGRGRR